MRLRRPRPMHQETDPKEQPAWKKLAQTVTDLETQSPDAEVEVWAEDEHRMGLHPVNRQSWVPEGEPPIALVNWKYKWLWLVGLVCPTTGETYWWIVPCLNHEVFSPGLADVAQHVSIGAHQRVI